MRQVVEQQASEITRRAMYDEITGLPNRFLLQDRLSQAMALSDNSGKLTAVLSISLSAYRAVADLHGHDVAEDMIRAAAKRLESAVRSADTIGVNKPLASMVPPPLTLQANVGCVARAVAN